MPQLEMVEMDDVLIVQFTLSSIMADTAITRTGEELTELVNHSSNKILLDFSHVRHMSSAMIGKILAFNQECKGYKITVKLCNLEPHLKEVFVNTGLHRMLKIYPTRKEAMAAFRKKGWFS